MKVSTSGVVLYVATLIVVVVGVDILFFRHHFVARLVANIVIVVVFAACYLTFLKRQRVRVDLGSSEATACLLDDQFEPVAHGSRT
jgi:uncharacterized membrane-anchored protein YitT (DUF2179 family)